MITVVATNYRTCQVSAQHFRDTLTFDRPSNPTLIFRTSSLAGLSSPVILCICGDAARCALGARLS